jgi:hypothetical protein
VAKSELAGVTANIKQVSRVTNCMIISLICVSMSGGWSPTGTFVIPGKSINVKFKTVSKAAVGREFIVEDHTCKSIPHKKLFITCLLLLTVWGMNSQVDRQRIYSLVASRKTVSIRLDLFPDLLEIGELLPLAVQELPVF